MAKVKSVNPKFIKLKLIKEKWFGLFQYEKTNSFLVKYYLEKKWRGVPFNEKEFEIIDQYF